MLTIKIALAIDNFLTALGRLFPNANRGFLPLGGDPFVQTAVLLLLAVSIGEVAGQISKRIKSRGGGKPKEDEE